MARTILVTTAIIFICIQPLAAQRSAWELLLSENPEAADDRSIGWQDRLILHALTPDQAQRYFSGHVPAENLILPNGESLAFYLEEKLNPEAHVYIPLVSPCPLFDLRGSSAEVQRLQFQGGDLSAQGGSASGCPISAQAAALLLQVQVESLSGFPVRVKLWSPEGPEPAAMSASEDVVDFPLSYETMLVVPLCGGEDCRPGEFEMKISEAAAISGDVVGYFRPLAASDQPGGGILFATENPNETFFGVGAGANNAGDDNSFFGRDAGNANTTGSRNSFFGDTAGASNTEGSANSFFGKEAGLFNSTGFSNSFFGLNAGRSNSTGSENSFFGEGAGFGNNEGFDNSFFGVDAGRSNSTGGQNSFFGKDAGNNNTVGFSNSFFGQESGLNNTTGLFNSFFGNSAGSSSNGNLNAFFGTFAGFDNTGGNNNSFFGASAGDGNTTGSNNTYIGFVAKGDSDLTNATSLGFRAKVSQSDSLVLGSINGLNGATASARVGIGTDIPKAPLHVQRSDGTVQIIRAQSTGPEAVRNMMDLINNGIPQFRLVDASANRDAWQFSNTNSGLNISLQGSGSQEFLIEDDGDVFINNGTIQVTSSRETKQDFEVVNPEEVLGLLAQLSISEWRYKKDPDSVRHMGPVSEDFYRLFGLGEGDKHITPTDMSGVALAAIQGLIEQNQRLQSELSELRQQFEEFKQVRSQKVYTGVQRD